MHRNTLTIGLIVTICLLCAPQMSAARYLASCPGGYTFNPVSGLCEGGAACTVGDYVPARNRCEYEATDITLKFTKPIYKTADGRLYSSNVAGSVLYGWMLSPEVVGLVNGFTIQHIPPANGGNYQLTGSNGGGSYPVFGFVQTSFDEPPTAQFVYMVKTSPGREIYASAVPGADYIGKVSTISRSIYLSGTCPLGGVFDETQWVCAVDPSGGTVAPSCPSGGQLSGAWCICTTPAVPPWTDPVLTPGTTKIRATHLNELRTQINAKRDDALLAAFGWTDPVLTPGTTKIRATHLNELRTGIQQVYQACGQVAPAFTDPVITPNTTKIRATHLNELRNATAAAP